MWVGDQRHAPAVLPPVMTRYPLYRGLGGLQSRSGRVKKISPSPGSDPRTVQPVAICYTDWAIPGTEARPKRREYLAVSMQKSSVRISTAASTSNVNYCQGQIASVDTFVVVSFVSCWKTRQYFAKWICSCHEVTGWEGTKLTVVCLIWLQHWNLGLKLHTRGKKYVHFVMWVVL